MNIIKKDPTAANGGANKSINYNATPSHASNQRNNEQEFLDAMRQSGIACHEKIVADGEIHRFAPDGKGNKDGWYVFYGMAGAFGDWSCDIKENWSIKYDLLTFAERKIVQEQMELSKKTQAEQAEKVALRQEAAAQEADTKWQSYALTGQSGYLTRKMIPAIGTRFDQNTIVVPIKDIEGKIWSLQYIHESGFKSFLTGGRKKRCFHVLGDTLEDTPFIYVAEGYATATSVHMATGTPVVVAFDADNIEPVVKALKQKYSSLKICITGDDDQWKGSNTGRIRAEEAANKHGCSVVFPVFKNTDTKPTDWNDLHVLEGLEAVKSQLEKQQECKAENMTVHNQTNIPILPYGYRVTKSGIQYLTILKIDKETEVEEWTFMCSHLIVTVWTCDENDLNHGRILEYIDPKGIKKEYVMPMELLAGSGEELRKNLLSRGVCLASKVQARNKFLDYLSSSKPTAKATCVDKVGWFKKQYILPEKVYGLATERVFLPSHSVIQKIEYSGTIEEWQQYIGRYIVGNPILYLSACAALAAPLLPLLGEENFAIHLSGSSSIGKTTAIRVARSIWGNQIHSWRTTDNAAESLARNANDGLLIFDELGEVDAKAADNMAYMLGNGSGKGRANKKGDVRPIITFRAVILSTGEVGLEGKLNDIGKTQRAGQSVRFIEVYADMGNDYGIYKTLHDFEKGEQLSDYLKQATEQYSGVIIDAWLIHLTQNKETQETIIQFIKALQKEWMDKFVPTNANGQVARCGRKFSLLAAVGEVVTFLNFLPQHPNEAKQDAPTLGILSESLNELFQSWVERRGGNNSHELTEIINRLISFINEHGSSRFENPWGKNTENTYTQDIAVEQKTYNRAGYRKFEDEAWNYYFFPNIFYDEILKGKDQKTFLKELANKGAILQDNQGNNTQSIFIPREKQQRVICIAPAITSVGGDNE